MNNSIRQLEPEEFPALLREINDPPEKLCMRGTLPGDDMRYLCVVGSRTYSPYGKEVCERLVAGLAGHPVVVVSGLALGIDSIAHRAALSAGLATIAVPGSGLSWSALYPQTHLRLAKQILAKGGALVSEFANDFRATPYSFPQRNRIMAGLSHAVLVIEAKEKSGTLITARLASEYNRDVLAVPHSIFSHGSHGPHMLLRLGAAVATTSADILEILGFDTAHTAPNYDNANLSEDERKVVSLLTAPCSRDELVAKLGMPVSQANTLLTSMELRGFIKERLGEIHLT